MAVLPDADRLTLWADLMRESSNNRDVLALLKADLRAAIDASASVVSGPAGSVAFQWETTDTDEPGYYLASWRVVFPDLTVATVPNDGDLLVRIATEA